MDIAVPQVMMNLGFVSVVITAGKATKLYFKTPSAKLLALVTYPKRIDDSIDKACTNCNTTIHCLIHSMTPCPSLSHIKAQHNINC